MASGKNKEKGSNKDDYKPAKRIAVESMEKKKDSFHGAKEK